MNRHIVRVSASQNLLAETMTQGWNTVNRTITCIRGLPEGAEYAGATFDPARLDTFYFFTHPSFAEVQEGDEIPQMNIEYEQKTEGICVK
jgi:hypothetical protein